MDFLLPSSTPIPLAEAQARRQSQYKSRVSSGSSPARTNSAILAADSQKGILRNRFKERCLEQAGKARAKARAASTRSHRSSDGFDQVMNDDTEETDDDIMESELYHRLMLNQAHQQRQALRRSYYAQVGSSFDPDTEDVTAWEQEVNASDSAAATSRTTEMSPEELEQAELEAYAEECERQAALADFESIPFDELFALDDAELRELMMSNEESRGGDINMDG